MYLNDSNPSAPARYTMSTTTQANTDYLEIDTQVLELGYKNCKASAKHFFGPFLWMISNMTGHHRRGMEAVLAHIARVSSFLELLSTDGLPLETWADYRNEVSQALAGQCRKSELAALADTVERFQIPRQFVFDPINAADARIRNREFKTFDQYAAFTSQLGGSPMGAFMQIFEIRADPKWWHSLAIRGGQAVLQAQLLSTFIQDLQQGQMYIPQCELSACKVDLETVQAGEADKSFRHFCRVQASRIESKLEGLGQLVRFVEFDGQRVMTSLLAYFCNLLFKIKADPSSLFDPEGPVSKREMFKFKAKHWMGIQNKVSCIHEDEDHH